MDGVVRRAQTAPDVSRALRELHRSTRHLQAVELPRLRREARTDAEHANADLRLQYLLRQIDQEQWRAKLQQREKKRERAFAVLQVYDMFCAVATDVFRALVRADRAPADCAAELQQLEAFANTSLATISKRFNMRVKRLRG